jgi:hypothetical protein
MLNSYERCRGQLLCCIFYDISSQHKTYSYKDFCLTKLKHVRSNVSIHIYVNIKIIGFMNFCVSSRVANNKRTERGNWMSPSSCEVEEGDTYTL